MARDATEALFRDVVEVLADRFEPALCDTYATVFADVIGQVWPGTSADAVRERYRRVRVCPRYHAAADPAHVVVLSRVTLGADVALTSIVLDGLKRRFPSSRIVFAGPPKNAELFTADRRIEVLPVSYQRSALLRARLEAAHVLRHALPDGGTIVVDPDSRLTQLGLLPVCEEAQYFFFESRSYGGDSHDSLYILTRDWMKRTFGVSEARPFLALKQRPPEPGPIVISFGCGENQRKRLGDEFERALVQQLAASGMPVLLDRGGSPEERQRIDRLTAAMGGHVQVHDGSFTSLAAQIAASRLYVGYDSGGQHVAAAAGTSLVTIFAGYACRRMMERWRPVSAHWTAVIDAEGRPWQEVLTETNAAIEAGLAAHPRSSSHSPRAVLS